MNKRVVWKCPIDIGQSVIHCPHGAKMLHVAIQNDLAWIWFLADPDEPIAARAILVVVTGHPMLPGACHTYVGTVIEERTGQVWHVFDKGQVVR